MSCSSGGPHPRVPYQGGMLGVAQGLNREGSIRTVLPSVALPTGLGSRLTRGRTNHFKPPRNALILPTGTMSSMPPVHLTFGAGQTFYTQPAALIWGLDDMLFSPIGQHILNYEPPYRFVMPTFTIFDGFNDPYDHMLYYNQVMTLNTGNDCLLCKVFLASLRGHALGWFHKLPRNLINAFNELWTAFISQYLCSVR